LSNTCWRYLARSANLPEGIYILLALISSFFNMSKALSIYWTDFHNLFTKWKIFAWIFLIRYSFSYSSRDVAMATNLVAKMGQNYQPSPALITLSIQNGMGYRLAFIAPLIDVHRVKKMVKIGWVVFKLKWVRKWKLCCDSAKIGLYRQISQQLLNQSLPTFQHANSPDVASGTVARRLRIDVHDDDDNDDDNAWQRGPLWPHGMSPKRKKLMQAKYIARSAT